MTERNLYSELFELQDGHCGICGRRAPLVEDHDHHSGLVRGLLCVGCNNAEGQHRCDHVWSDCAICTWQLRPAVAWLGWTERYTGVGIVTEWHLEAPWQPTAQVAESVRDSHAARADIIARLYADELAS